MEKYMTYYVIKVTEYLKSNIGLLCDEEQVLAGCWRLPSCSDYESLVVWSPRADRAAPNPRSGILPIRLHVRTWRVNLENDRQYTNV